MSRMKSLLKRALGNAAVRLPWGAREAVFDALCAKLGAHAVITRVAAEAGVTAITATGRYGEIRSAVNDWNAFLEYARSGQWARRTNDLLIGFFADRGGTYIDVGANIGLTTIPVAQNPAVRCVAIEPEPNNYANLTANVRLNCPHGNVETHQVAVFDKPATLRFEISSGNLGDHRIRTTELPGAIGEERRPVIEVPGRPLREIVGAVALPLAVKIDTQGAEPFVVAGGREILAAADLLVIEFWPYGMKRLGGDPNEVIALLSGFHSLAISLREEDAAKEMAVPEAIDLLRSAAQSRIHDEPFYFDVTARR